MARNGGPGSAALHVILYFNRNPEEELTSQDVTTKFGIAPNVVWRKLGQSVRDNMLVYDSSGPGRGKAGIWRAGPRLLEMCGQRYQQAAEQGGNASANNRARVCFQ